MVGTYANGWLAQLRNEWCRDRCMKLLKGDQQLRSVSLSYSVALQALKPKSSLRRRRGRDASTHRGLSESSGEVFSLDILSHRMSDKAMFQQLHVQCPMVRWQLEWKLSTQRFTLRLVLVCSEWGCRGRDRRLSRVIDQRATLADVGLAR